jgi:hypothetical protein
METDINVYLHRLTTGSVLLISLLAAAGVPAQSQLPAPSRTIYKCKVQGRVSYSDEPCVGAERLDATPARGVDRLSGSSRTGKDVAAEIRVEQIATAVRLLSGMSNAQFATAVRRQNLEPAVQRECRQLEPVILGLEQSEKQADAVAVKEVQQELFVLRKRYKSLAC